jgi:hypothetical protein
MKLSLQAQQSHPLLQNSSHASPVPPDIYIYYTTPRFSFFSFSCSDRLAALARTSATNIIPSLYRRFMMTHGDLCAVTRQLRPFRSRSAFLLLFQDIRAAPPSDLFVMHPLYVFPFLPFSSLASPTLFAKPRVHYTTTTTFIKANRLGIKNGRRKIDIGAGGLVG